MTMSNPEVDFNNARRAALHCLADPDEFAPAYLQLAMDRMIQAAQDMAPRQLASGACLPAPQAQEKARENQWLPRELLIAK
ncbi:MAG: hypothetical protein GXY36_12140 [Chloroflexi bacterium]|jgi:hypothetical protein|nr:hypothetical protein [Chloroflexota bacterium]